MICKCCGQHISEDSQFCNYCGELQETAASQRKHVCPVCGSAFDSENTFCNKCGARLIEVVKGPQKAKPRWLPVLIAVLACVCVGVALFLIGWLGGYINW